ncbi:F-box/kelch-repeat protein At3g23880-like [Chenopodium quinoa]|uniref:F-box/kelch-repeat protein At3g23880-like n=1 Tax=Chenopodium quinoa TaxID=63459 RepID=UPI000B77D44C|nr:F-box/kelch-repeat protein At3g23880-like [Chenopodium quinoa]
MESKKMRMSDEQLIAKDIDIPIELLRDEILARLPVKTQLQIRCVCKLWCSVIDSQDFRLNPNIRKTPHLIYIHSENNGLTSDQCIVTLRNVDTFEIINHLCKMYGSYEFYGTCNGLMLMSQKLFGDKSILRVWNPSIQKSLLLPSCPLNSEPQHRLTYMLGYPSSDGDNNFKVAAFKCHPGSSLLGGSYVSIAIYSSRGHRWSSVIKRNDVLFPPSLTDRVFYQGAWYWITKTNLVSFDFNLEDFIFQELPVEVMQGEVTRFIFLLCEKLAILSVSSKCFCVWVMDKDRRKMPSWRPWLSRDTTHEALDKICDLQYIHSRIFYNERDSDTFIFQDTKKVFSYKFSTQQKQILRSPYESEVILDAYAESLVLHKGTDGQILTSYPSHDKTVVAWPTLEDHW